MASVEYDCSMCGTVSNHMPTHSIRLFNLQPTNSSISKLIEGSFTVSLKKKSAIVVVQILIILNAPASCNHHSLWSYF